jgi:hypothetical protein
VAEAKLEGDHLNLILNRARTRCRARERRQSKTADDSCDSSAPCC